MFIKQFFIEGIDFIRQIYLNRFLIYELTKRDFKIKYVNNLFGLSWAILEPLAMMVVLWFVFTYIQAGKSSDVPYPLFLLTGLILYDFFNKTINSASWGILNYGFLINKVNFRAAIIPIVKISSDVILHLIILGIIAIILLLNHVPVTLYWFQVFYYLFATILLLTGISWFTSSVSIFFPDIHYIITIVMRVLFFFTPIFWSATEVPSTFSTFFRLNPLYYLVNGYRDSFLYGIPFWHHRTDTIYFAGLTFFFLIMGAIVFKRLRPYFAEMI
jgi:lipopolysaccharide transport system permease protein/teichoic acid transport system permease protein